MTFLLKWLPFSILCLSFALSTIHGDGEASEVCPYQGTLLRLGDDQFLELSIEDKRLHAHCVDAEGKLIEVPLVSVQIIIQHPGHRQNKWRALLKPSGELHYSSPRLFHGPNTFRAHLILAFEDREKMTFTRHLVHLDATAESTIQ